MKVTKIRTLILTTLSVLATACGNYAAFTYDDERAPPPLADEITVAHYPDGNSTFDLSRRQVRGYRSVRRAAAVAQAGILMSRSFQVDPLNRPLTNAMSLSSYVLKSTGGMLRRIAIDTAGFPALQAQPVPAYHAGPGMDLRDWEKDLDRISGRKPTRGTIRFLVGGDEFFSRFAEAIRGARRSIDIRTYIFDNDDYAVAVAEELKIKSANVRVRIMFDGIGNLLAMQTDPDSMPGHFRAPVSMEAYLQENSKIRVRSRANPWLTGDHTKTTIIDSRTAFLGGMNIGREYRYEWHDIMMELNGPVVDRLQYDMDRAWAGASLFGDIARVFATLAGEKKVADDTGYPLRLLYTRSFDSQIYRAQLAAIRRAKRYILIENSYFSDDIILYELAKARRRGVDVRVILPADGNHGSHDASNRVAINRMLENGIRVYRYPGMNHVKAAIVDGWACVGTANFDKLSLEVNKEVNVATSHPPAVMELLHKVFLPDLADAEEILQPVDISFRERILEVVTDEFL